MDFSTDFNAGDEYYWSHGLISDVVYQLLTKVCNGSELMRSAINGEESIACTAVSIRLNKELSDSIDNYDVIGDICLFPFKSQMDMLHEPLKSRFQTLSSLNSQSNALNQQVSLQTCVKAHVMCAHYLF